MNRENVEYILHDFLEVHFGTRELENAQLVKFLMERVKETPQVGMDLVSGIAVNNLLLAVVSNPRDVKYEECLLLNSETRRKAHYCKWTEKERLLL